MEDHIKAILPMLNEKQKRLFLASCANTLGRGGVKTVCEISGSSKMTVIKGKKELSSEKNKNSERVRKRGGGRKKLEVEYPELQKWIEEIVWCFRANVLPHTSQKSCRSKAALAVLLVFCNHSQSKTLYQTKHMAIQKSYCCGQRKIQEAILSKYEVYISFKSIGVQLQKLGYSSQGNKKMLQVGEPHPDRNEQFEFINDMAKFMIFYGQPVISVDTKKKPSVISRMTERNTVRKTTREKYWIMISQ